jgi:large conductance mechanosensitive channel
MSLVKEFKEFAVKGNMIDMAVGIIIGAAFGKIVASLVSNVIMPPLGMVIGGVNFADLSVVLGNSLADGKPVVLGYGAFLQTLFDFLIVAVAIFTVVKAINTLKKKAPPPDAAPIISSTDQLLIEIRDNLKRSKS